MRRNVCIVTSYNKNYKELTNQTGALYENWENVLMHLPYCFQARRTFVEIYAKENQLTDENKVIAKSEAYLDFVNKAETVS